MISVLGYMVQKPRSIYFFEKILVLTDFDQMKTPPSYTSLESYGSWLFNHIAQNTDHLTCQPSEFRGRSWTDFLDDPRLRHTSLPLFEVSSRRFANDPAP